MFLDAHRANDTCTNVASYDQMPSVHTGTNRRSRKLTLLDASMNLSTFFLCFLILLSITTVSPQPIWKPFPPRRPTNEPFTSIVTPRTKWDFQCEVFPATENLAWRPNDGPGAAFLQASQPTDMLPLRINYVLAEGTSREFEFTLQWAFRRANAFLAKRIKSEIQPLDSMRLVRDSACTFPARCFVDGVNVPNEYLGQCPSGIEKGALNKPSEYLKLLAAKHVSTMIYVRVWNPKRPTPGCALAQRTIWAYTSRCLFNYKDSRPLHSVIVLCKQPNELEDDHLLAVLLHETIHALSAGSFVGERTTKYLPHDGPIHEWEYAARKALLINQTWRQMQHPWSRKNLGPGPGKVVPAATVELVATPTVMDVVKDYFRCYDGSLQGAELNRKKFVDGVRPDVAHWSMRLFPEEIISPMPYGPDMRLSRLTLAMLKDTGWYEVNMSAAQPLDYDASRARSGGRYCHMATHGCDEILSNSKLQLERNANILPWVGPYCDPLGSTATRACSPDGRFRLQCINGAPDYDRTLGCSVYVKSSTIDAVGMDCPDQKRSREDAIALVGHPYRSMCIPFQNYKYAWSSSTWRNHPACYEFNCTRETRSFDIHVLIPGQDPCKLSQFCGDGKPAVKSWSGCWPPRSGTVICPVYEDVCVKPGGVGNPNTTMHWPSDQARQKPNDTRGPSSSGHSALWKFSSFLVALGLAIAVLWTILVP